MLINKKMIMRVMKKAYSRAAEDDEIKENLAYREIIFSWNIEDIQFWFTVKMGNGKIIVTDGQSENSDITFYNRKAEEFHRANIGELTGRDISDTNGFRWTGSMKYLRHVSQLCKVMRVYYKQFAPRT